MKAKGEAGSRRSNSWDGHQFKGHEFEEPLRDSGGRKSLECCSPWVHKESDTTKWLNDNNTLRVQNDDHSVMQLSEGWRWRCSWWRENFFFPSETAKKIIVSYSFSLTSVTHEKLSQWKEKVYIFINKLCLK